MRTLSILAANLAIVAAFTSVAGAQSCSNLSATLGTTTLSLDLTGAPPHSPTVIFVGRHQGSTTFGNNLFTIDLNPPFRHLRFGMTDANGDRTRVVHLPPHVPSGITLLFQTVTIDFMSPPATPHGPFHNATFCVSNLASITTP